MKTGSLINHLQMNSKPKAPVTGEGATVLGWTDRTAYFVDKVSKDGKSCTIEQANSIRIDNNGMSESQKYRYDRHENIKPTILRFRYGSWWIDHGKEAHDRYSKINIVFGHMDEYYDYSF